MAREARLARAAVSAYVRASKDKIEAVSAVSSPDTNRSLRLAVKPPKVSGSLRKAGTVLVLAPDPITAVPGIAMVGASYAIKRREPAGLEDLAKETARRLRELESLF